MAEGRGVAMERIVFTHGMAARESDRFGEWKEIDCEPVPLTLGELTLSMGLAADQIAWDTQRFMRYIKWRHV
jgi:hypothetical protein